MDTFRAVIVYKMNRHPVRKKTAKPTDSHSFVSYGTNEWKILQYLFIHKGERFNKCQASRDLRVPRSSIYGAINTLSNKGCVKIPYYGHAVITKKGINSLNAIGGGAESSARGCRQGGVGKLSQHYSKFTMQITGKETYSIDKAKSKGWHHEPIEMKNWQYDLYKIDEDSIAINPKTVVIRIHDIITDTTDESMFKAVLGAKEYVEQLKEIGITGKGFSYGGAHFARIDSYLSRFLAKVDNKYFLKLKDDSAFWLDNSHGLEDETDSIEVRNNIDYNMQQLLENQFDFKDLFGRLDKLESINKEQTKQIYMIYKLEEKAAVFKQPIANGIDRSKMPSYIY